MAEYPWGPQAPAKRVAAVQAQIAANDAKRTECIESHRKRLSEIDDADRKLKSELRQASQVVEREERDATVAAAAKAFERVMANLMGQGIDVGAMVRSGEFEKILGKAVADAGPDAGAARGRGARKAVDPAPAAD